jgi:hypothetical protein
MICVMAIIMVILPVVIESGYSRYNRQSGKFLPIHKTKTRTNITLQI